MHEADSSITAKGLELPERSNCQRPVQIEPQAHRYEAVGKHDGSRNSNGSGADVHGLGCLHAAPVSAQEESIVERQPC
jgi:hypothetical protein